MGCEVKDGGMVQDSQAVIVVKVIFLMSSEHVYVSVGFAYKFELCVIFSSHIEPVNLNRSE